MICLQCCFVSQPFSYPTMMSCLCVMIRICMRLPAVRRVSTPDRQLTLSTSRAASISSASRMGHGYC